MKKTRSIVAFFIGCIVGAICIYMLLKKELVPKIKEKNVILEKFTAFYWLLVEWLSVRQRNGDLITYFENKGYSTVAIYGMKELGERLNSELSDSSIKVKYVIDQNADYVWTELDAYKPDDELPDVDVIVVTVINQFESIKNQLQKKVNCPIVSLEDVVFH